MRILVTGGAGFIGSNLALALQARGPEDEIVVVDDFSSGSWANLAEFRGDLVTADMTEMSWSVAVADEPFDQIYHLAANTDARDPNQAKVMRQNVEAFRYLLEFAAESQTPVVYATSAATYGIRDGVMKETDERKPFSIYAFSKCVMENVAAQVVAKGDGDWRVCGVRYFNVYGPRETHKGVPASMIFHLAHQIRDGKRPRLFKFGEQTRDHVYVKDIVAGTMLAMEKGAAGGIYNLGSGHARSFNDVVAAVNAALGKHAEPEYIDNPYSGYQHHTEADLAHSKKVLGYKPAWTLEAGVKDYLGWLFG
jgi:ADP-L-glycero-D-manno-heptose 6-epimerase